VDCDPAGTIIEESEYRRREGEWLPTDADRAFVKSLMRQVIAPGKMAGWIAPPERGINNLPIEHEYVRL
jgi:benzoyl-CoA 2,3-dioxygenase component B